MHSAWHRLQVSRTHDVAAEDACYSQYVSCIHVHIGQQCSGDKNSIRVLLWPSREQLPAVAQPIFWPQHSICTNAALPAGSACRFLTGKHTLPAFCVHTDAHQQHAHSAPFNHHTNPLPPTSLNTAAPCPALPTSVKPKAPTRPPSLCCCAERIRLCVGRIALARQAEQRPRPSAAVDVQPAVDDFSRVCLLSLVSNEPRHCRLVG